jgi:hypothetical protein
MQNKRTTSLLELIGEASFLTDDQKREFMKLAKNANKTIYNEMVQFFSDAKEQMLEINNRYELMRQKMYQAYMSHVKDTLTTAQHYISSTINATPIDETDDTVVSHSLLNGLLRIFKPSKVVIS